MQEQPSVGEDGMESITLHDKVLGPCDVYIVCDLEYGIDSFVHSGYIINTFEELTEEECEHLTEEFRDDIAIYTESRVEKHNRETN